MPVIKATSFIALLALAGALSCRDSTSPKFGKPVHMVPLGDIGKTAVAGEPVPLLPSVLITDDQDRPVPGVTVTFLIAIGGGSITGATPVTNSNGIATVGAWRLGSGFGTKVLIASATLLPTVSFTIRGIAPDEGVLAFDIADPAGDTLNRPDILSGRPDTLPATDLVGVRGDFKRDSLILTMTFTGPVRATNPNVPNSIAGAFEIDIDDDARTGYAPPFSDNYGGTATLGIDYALNLSVADPNGVQIFNAFGGRGRVRASYVGNSMVVRIPFGFLNNDDGNFSFVAIIGTINRATDLFPDGGFSSVRHSLGLTSTVAGAVRREAQAHAHPFDPGTGRLSRW